MKFGTQINPDGTVTKIPVVNGSKKDMKELTKYVIKNTEVSKVLSDLQTIDQKSVGDGKGNLDLEKFNEHPKTIEAVKKLKKMGVTKKWLFKNGFMPAGMILWFGDTKVSERKGKGKA